MEYLQKLNNIFKVRYSINDIKFLSKLIDTKMPIKTCLDIISSSKTKGISNDISKKLDEGELFEDIISDYVPKDISKYFEKLIKLLGFNKTIDISLNIIETRKKNIDDVLGKALYPLILMFVSIIALIIFDNFGLDSIIQMMSSFIDDLSLISLFRGVFSIVTKVLFIILILVIGICIAWFGFNKQVFIYEFINKIFKDNIINVYFTNEFINLYTIIINNGYKTKEALDIIKELDNMKICSCIADEVSNSLKEGNDLVNSVDIEELDSSLSKFFMIASYSKDYLSILLSYLEYSKAKVNIFIKKVTAYIQGSSYAVIGLIIIFVYQLLFMPMQAITGF